MNKKREIYLRVSTTIQTTEQQEAAVRAAMPDGPEPSVRVETVSGWTGHGRDQYDALKTAIAAGEVSEVWTFAIDRLGRDWWEIMRFGILCHDCDVSLHCVRDHLHSDNSDYKFRLSVLGWMAECESHQQSERIKAKLVYLKSEYGYTHHGSPPGYLTPQVLAQLEVIRAMLAAGETYVHISEVTGLDQRTVAKIAKDPDRKWLTKKEMCEKIGKWYKRPEDYGAPMNPRRRDRKP
jgi:DNA invertase Pin-like site-specific DNA recombinase